MKTRLVNTEKIDLPEEIIRKWQGAVDILASVVQVPAALVMRLPGPEIEVFVSSRTEGNPYTPGDREHFEGSGLYCETVIKSLDRLIMPNARKAEKWKNNPDIKLGMISYLGFPILFPSGNPFGTICVLDSKENHFGESVEKIMGQFRELFETHLALIQRNERLEESLSEISRLSVELEKAANSDPLTGLFNRRIFPLTFNRERSRHGRTGRPLCLVMGDLDGFKGVNDRSGHAAGDMVLKRVARALENRARHHDYLWRWGGDEFLALLPETHVEGGVAFVKSVQEALSGAGSDPTDEGSGISMCFGVTGLLPGESAEDVLGRCDRLLYEAKDKGKGCIRHDDF